jgi:hypothetical protein
LQLCRLRTRSYSVERSGVQQEIGELVNVLSWNLGSVPLTSRPGCSVCRLRALLDKAHTLNAEEGFEEVEDDNDFEDNRTLPTIL